MKSVILSDSIDHINPTAISGTSLKLVPKGSVLIVVRGMILAHTVPVAVTTVPLTINQDLKALVPSAGLESTYLLWALKVAH